MQKFPLATNGWRIKRYSRWGPITPDPEPDFRDLKANSTSIKERIAAWGSDEVTGPEIYALFRLGQIA